MDQGETIMENRDPDVPLRDADGLRPTPARGCDGHPEPDPDTLLPQGPALLYVHSDPGLLLGKRDRTVTRVDLGVPSEGGPVSVEEACRERMILRALLNQALYLLGPEEAEG